MYIFFLHKYNLFKNHLEANVISIVNNERQPLLPF